MKSQLFSIFDDVAKVHQRPFVAPNSAVATRALADIMRDDTHELFLHAADFTLNRIGVFDDELGLIDVTDFNEPVFVAHLSNIKQAVIFDLDTDESGNFVHDDTDVQGDN